MTILGREKKNRDIYAKMTVLGKKIRNISRKMTILWRKKFGYFRGNDHFGEWEFFFGGGQKRLIQGYPKKQRIFTLFFLFFWKTEKVSRFFLFLGCGYHLVGLELTTVGCLMQSINSSKLIVVTKHLLGSKINLGQRDRLKEPIIQ